MEEDNYSLFAQMLKHGKSLRLSYGQRRVFLREDYSSPLFTMSLALAVAVRKIFREKASVSFSREPAIEKRPVTQFMRRLRVDPMEKFNGPTVVSAIQFYLNRKDMDQGKPAGLVLCYVETAHLAHLLRLLQYPEIDDDEEEQVEDACGALCNIIAGYFKKELTSLGYPALEMSSFESYINSVVNGVEYPAKAPHKYEISYEIDGQKRLVTEMIMSPMPKSLS